MPLLTLEEVKLWLRHEEGEENAQLQTLMRAAELAIRDLIDPRPVDWSDERTKLLAIALIADWYEHREMIGKGPSDKMRPVYRMLVSQLRYGVQGGLDQGGEGE